MNEWRRTARSRSLEAVSTSTRLAREMMRGVCSEASISPRVSETAQLLVSELVTNAVVHGSGRPVLDIAVRPDALRATVTDQSAGSARLRAATSLRGGRGRGLLLVESLAARWGSDRRVPTGRSVWFELDHDLDHD